jgi:hypothetical protein
MIDNLSMVVGSYLYENWEFATQIKVRDLNETYRSPSTDWKTIFDGEWYDEPYTVGSGEFETTYDPCWQLDARSESSIGIAGSDAKMLQSTTPSFLQGLSYRTFSDGENVGAWVVHNEPTLIPIPGAVWLLGSGLIGLFGLRRKFKF